MDSPAERDDRLLLQTKVFAALLGVFDFLFYPLVFAAGAAAAEVTLLLSASVLFAQACLVAAWGVFSSKDFVPRLAKCATLGFGAYLCSILGLAVCAPSMRMEFDEFVSVVLVYLSCLPIVFFCIQLPLWAARVWLRWEIAVPGGPREGSYARPVMIKDIFVATAAVSVALSLVRLAPLLTPEQLDANEFMVAVSIMVMVMAGASLLTLPPLLFCILGPRPFATGATYALVWCGILTFLAMMSVSVLFGAFPSPGGIVCVAMAVGIFLGVVSFGYYLVRQLGYRLRWSRTGVSEDEV